MKLKPYELIKVTYYYGCYPFNKINLLAPHG